MRELRETCAAVAARARHVTVAHGVIADYAARLPAATSDAAVCGAAGAERERLATFWLTLDAINYGSGWFPTLRKRDGRSGYGTISAALGEHFDAAGPWPAVQLSELDAATVAAVLGQDPAHELMGLFAASLRDLGARVSGRYGGSFAAVADGAAGSALALVRTLGGWPCFADTSVHDGVALPFLKRAQLAAADLQRAGVATFSDLGSLTLFADNLVPHVLRLDGVLRFDPGLVARIAREELIAHGSPEEIEIRACAVHAVELIVAATGTPNLTAAGVDQVLWERGGQPRYKASPRHRSRCTAY